MYISYLHIIPFICSCSILYSFPSTTILRNIYESRLSYDKGIVTECLNKLCLRDFALQSTQYDDKKNSPSFPDVSKIHSKLEKFSKDRDGIKFAQVLKSYASGPPQVAYSPNILIPLIHNLIDRFDATSFADCLWSLSRLNVNVRIPEQRALIIELVHGLCSQSVLTARQVTTSLGGLAKLNMRWDEFPVEIKEDIIKGLTSVCAAFNPREIGNVFHSLQKLEIPWTSLPVTLQNGLLDTFVAHADGLVSFQGAMSIYALGLMNLDTAQLTTKVQKTIFSVSLGVLKEAETNIHPSIAQQTSNIIYGLAKLGLALPENVRDQIIESLRCILGYMKEQEVANTVYSLGLLGFDWNRLPADIKQLIGSTIEIRIRKMIAQGVSTTLYGMSLMKADWDSMSPAYISAVFEACSTIFNSRVPDNKGRMSTTGRSNTQGVANAIYSIAICGARWSDLQPRVKVTLCQAVAQWLPHMTSQEVANIIYALGLMKADYHSFEYAFQQSLEENYRRIIPLMSQQEMSSAMHGFAKMSASWDIMHIDLRQTMLTSIVRQTNGLTNISLACCVYSLGLMGASWERLPVRLKDTFLHSMAGKGLRDQTISNIIYGMSLLKAEWGSLTPEFREILVETLAQPDAFKDDISQHIANVIWGLAKMDAAWDEVPMSALLEAFVRVAKVLGPQEISIIIYGLAELDMSWLDISEDIRELICEVILRNSNRLSMQELANIMYSLAKFTFDYQLDLSENINSITSKEKQNDSTLLYKVHVAILKAFHETAPEDIESENFDQLAIYFELLVTIPGGVDLAERILGGVPSISGPCATVPSRLHANVASALLEFLRRTSSDYSIFNEFCGLSGTFPIDSAVYLGEKLVAFVEIDGEFHYKQLSQKLRRKDKLKEHLYRVRYPDVPLFRIRSDQCSAIGYDRAGQSLASWIGALQSGERRRQR